MTTLAVSGPARVEYGEVFTRRWVVDLMLDLAGYTAATNLTRLTVVEPSVGSGAFVGPILDRLLDAREAHAAEQPWEVLSRCIRGWDLQADHIESTRNLAVASLIAAGCPEPVAIDLARGWLQVGDFLLADRGASTADLVIGNPPYIRIEDLPAELLAAYRSSCPTMGGRSDIFVGFYEHGLDLLAPDGRLAYICADRWMRNAYGRALRRLIVEGGFAADVVLIMHEVDAFEASVSAYPAVTVLRRGDQGVVVNGEAGSNFGEADAARFADWADGSDERPPVGSRFDAARLSGWHTTDDSWPDGPPETLAWLEELADHFPLLEDRASGTRIGIGVATGADRVFVVGPGELPKVESDRLLPLAMSADIKSGSFNWVGNHLVDPWTRDSTGLINLARYPATAAYLERHASALSGRHVAQRTAAWYRTIDRVNHDLLARPMLVMEDMKAQAHPVFVPKGFYPHHNLYYVVSDAWDLEVLGGLLLSNVVERQVAAYCVKMRGGTLRFQAQYLRRIRCPRPGNLGADVAAALATAFRRRDRDAATVAALAAYDLPSLPGRAPTDVRSS